MKHTSFWLCIEMLVCIDDQGEHRAYADMHLVTTSGAIVKYSVEVKPYMGSLSELQTLVLILLHCPNWVHNLASL